MISWCTRPDIWTLSVFILINLKGLTQQYDLLIRNLKWISLCHFLHLDKQLLIFLQEKRKITDMFTIKTMIYLLTLHCYMAPSNSFFVLFSLYVQSVETPPLLRVHIGARPGHMVSQEKTSCSFIDCSYLFWSTSRHLESHTHVVSGAMDKYTVVNELWNAWGLDLTVIYLFFILGWAQRCCTKYCTAASKSSCTIYMAHVHLDSLFHLTLI